MEFNLNPTQFWLIFGFITIIFEIFFISGVGLVFAGLGAITVAGIISVNHDAIEYQYPIFAVSAFIWLSVLWHPLKKYIHNKAVKNHPSDLIGKIVEVTERGLLPGSKIGQVKWSGTILNAKLSEEVACEQSIGTLLKIKAVEGNIVICTKI